jgi:putative hydrolase of the HAD superfamily
LIECWPSVGHIYADVATRHGCAAIDPAVLNRNFASAWRNLKDFRHTRQQWAALVDATFAGLVQPRPSETFFAELFERFAEPGAWRVFNDVLTTLEQLKQREFRLGIVSNWDERLRPLLSALRIDGYFDALTVSCEVEAEKPARAIFSEAARQLGVAPADILHVGDDFEKDVTGARRAGFEALLLRRGEGAAPPGVIRSLRELL